MTKEVAPVDVESNSGRDQLISFVERIEREEAEKATLADLIKDLYTEAKSVGYDVKVLRKLIARRKQDRDEVREQDAILELYEGIFQ